jgi:hypothetical protein
VALRLEPTADQLAQLAEERRTVRAVYKVSGVEAARERLHGTLWAFYTQNYLHWVQSGSLLPS